jgi:hypothetical protein
MSNLPYNGENLLEHAKNDIKDELYTYQFHYDNYYDEFINYLITETEARSSIWAWAIVVLSEASDMSSLDYVISCICDINETYTNQVFDCILATPELSKYHLFIKKIKKLFNEYLTQKEDRSKSIFYFSDIYDNMVKPEIVF